MRTQCCVIGCKNYTHDRKSRRLDDGVQFFIIPAWRQHHGQQVSELTKRRRMAWVSAIRQPDITFNSTAKHFVCSRHFFFGKPVDEMLEFDTDWTPTLRMGHGEEASPKRPTKRQPVNFTASAEPAPQTPELDKVLPPPLSTTRLVKARPEVDKECSSFNLGRDAVNSLLEEYRTVKKNLCQKQFDEEFFRDNDERVKYYTGLPSCPALIILVAHLHEFLRPDRNLSEFQQIVLTLIRLRLDWPNVHLAHMFGIDPTNAAIVFKNTIDVLYSKLGLFLRWPNRFDVYGLLPRKFEEAVGKGYVLIIDCIEIATTTSDHQEDTQKFAIGITPYGAPTYVTKGFMGALPDMAVAVLGGLFQDLQQGDIVLADSGFGAKERLSVGMLCTEVDKYGELDEIDARHSKNIAHHIGSNVRMVVESVRNQFNMLNHTIPACFCLQCEGEEDRTWLDKIVYVCCLLTTLGPTEVACGRRLDFSTVKNTRGELLFPNYPNIPKELPKL